MVYVIMGVAGSGKTTVGQLVAAALGLPFYDGDDYHPAGNLAKMSQGIPLSDEDRQPWLQTLAQEIERWNRRGGAVLSCSALRAGYRGTLTRNGAQQVAFIHLHGSPELLKSRLQRRKGHFFNPQLLESQLEALEIPEDAIAVEIGAAPEELARKILEALAARGLVQPSAQ